jgi:hypothetical protein
MLNRWITLNACGVILDDGQIRNLADGAIDNILTELLNRVLATVAVNDFSPIVYLFTA